MIVCAIGSPFLNPCIGQRRIHRAILVGALLAAVARLWAQTGRVRIRVTDTTGAVVPMAQVSLLGADNQPMRTFSSNDAGETAWQDLPLGDSRFQVSMRGFNSQRLTVTVRDSNENTVEAKLEVVSLPGILRAKRKWWQIFR
jgi:Carboxypeptidase regulatory-like domain